MTADSDPIGRYRIDKPPLMRQLQMDAYDAMAPGHAMTAFMELDVSVPLRRIARLQESGVQVSLFAHIVSAVARALAEYPELNTVRQHGRIAHFEDVDASVPVEVDTADGRFPLMLVIRRAQDKTALQIYEEIAAAKAHHKEAQSLGAEDRLARRAMSILAHFPRVLRLAVMRRIMGNAKSVKRMAGTTLITSVGKFATVPGFVTTFGTGPRATTFALGSVTNRPVVRNDEIVVRPILALTGLFNHDVVDGSPAARFGERLRELVESAQGLKRDATPGAAWDRATAATTDPAAGSSPPQPIVRGEASAA